MIAVWMLYATAIGGLVALAAVLAARAARDGGRARWGGLAACGTAR